MSNMKMCTPRHMTPRHNGYRLIAAIHFDRQTAYTLRFLTHAEYSRERWKDEL
ncbi:MAG: type II toxin-antitoxin system HigB family toxin [Verrucomicrobia bacterium]|nr:type II toxin-antitoxin system HigB family toxin [Verrucomicrobiota bacterium]